MKFEFKPEMWPVERRKFNPEQWGEKSINKRQNGTFYQSKSAANVEHDVEVVLQRIEESGIDLSMDYQDWLKLGFAFAHEFGEMGRGYFHRVSRFYSSYDYNSCDQQYNHCLKSNGSGVTIRSFFGMARDAGVDVRV